MLKIVAEVRFVNMTREDQNAKIVGGVGGMGWGWVFGVKFVITTSKDQDARIVVEVKFVSTTR